MTELSDFLATLAVDPAKLGEFIGDPDAVIAAADLSDGDKAALISGDIEGLAETTSLQAVAQMHSPVTVPSVSPPPLTT
jgi:hypothetical protein